MASLPGFNWRFTPRWQMSLLTFVFILLFARLGFWQLQRADQKEQMLMAHREFARLAPVEWKPEYPLPTQYQRIHVQGHFIAKIFLLDNQHVKHRFGYHVLSPFILTNGHVLLVDRGWVAGDIRRQDFPAIETPTGLIHVVGGAYFPSDKSWILGQVLEKKSDTLAVVELIDTKAIGQFLHQSVYPFIVRLDAEESNGYVREWPVIAMSPERHYAYAIQWFAMASVIFILFIALNVRQRPKQHNLL